MPRQAKATADWSPADVAPARVDADPITDRAELDFEQAFAALRDGETVRRSAWDDETRFLAWQGEMLVDSFFNGRLDACAPYTATHKDLVARDWVIKDAGASQ